MDGCNKTYRGRFNTSMYKNLRLQHGIGNTDGWDFTSLESEPVQCDPHDMVEEEACHPKKRRRNDAYTEELNNSTRNFVEGEELLVRFNKNMKVNLIPFELSYILCRHVRHGFLG